MLGNNPNNHKDINISLYSCKDETKSALSQSEISDINLIELNNQNNNQENFVYYTITNKFKEGINFIVKLNEDKSTKVNVVINKKTKFERIKNIILENFRKLDEKYKNTNNLKIFNLTKKGNKKDIKMNSEEEFYKNIIDGDVLYCDLVGDENWIKIKAKLKIMDNEKNISFNMKIEKDYLFKNLHYKALKCIFKIMGNLIQNSLKRKFHYVLNDLKCIIKNTNINQVFDLKNSNNENIYLMEFPIELLIKDNHEIEYELYLNIVENYLIKYFNSKKENDDNLSDRWLYFSEVKNIEDYENHKKFGPEFNYIKNYVNKYFNKLYKEEGRIKSKISKFYFENINLNQNNFGYNDEKTIFEISFENTNIPNTDDNSFKNNSLDEWNIMSESDFSEDIDNLDIRNMSKYVNLCEEFENLIDEIDFTNFLYENVEFKFDSSLLESEEYEKYVNLSLFEKQNSLTDKNTINNHDLASDKKLSKECKKIRNFIIFFSIIFALISFTIIYILDEIFENKNKNI